MKFSQFHHMFFFLAIVFLSFIAFIIFPNSEYNHMFTQYLDVLMWLSITFWGFVSIPNNLLNQVIQKYYFIAFVTGTVFLILTASHRLGRNEIFNENTIGLFLAPFLIYLCITMKNHFLRVIVYLLGGIYLFYSNAMASFVGFVLFPIFAFLLLRFKKSRMVYSLYIFVGLLVTLFIITLNSHFLTEILSNRNLLWKIYFKNIISSWQTFLFGTGNWYADIADPLLKGLHAHHAFLNIVHFTGVFALIFYLCLIIFSTRKQIKHFTVSDGILFFIVTFQFAESSVPLFNFMFPSMIFYWNLFLNKQSEDFLKS